MPIMSVAKRLFPNAFLHLKRATGRLYADEVNRLTLERCHGRVIDGPFTGMRYIDQSNCSALAPKLLGTYEKELQSVVGEIIAGDYDDVIDIGAAEGYYAVGLALKMPHSRIHAFDIDPAARENVKRLAALNRIESKISVHGECSFETLQSFAGRKCALICDIEGAERVLLDPEMAPALRTFDVLVEIHDGVHSNAIHDILVQRFAPSHSLRFIDHQERTAKDAATVPWLGHDRNRLLAVDEQRTFGIEWGFFRANAR